MKLGGCFLMLALVITVKAAQRASLVDRFKALDQEIRRGLGRAKPTHPPVQQTQKTLTTANQVEANPPLQDPLSAIAAAQAETLPQPQDLTANDNQRVLDVVRQLTETYEGHQLRLTKDDTETSKEGPLAAEDKPKPTKYHFYPHNQHMYLLPECATQQVCNAVYTRFNLTQPLCACADRFQGPCSASIGRNDLHTIEVSLSKNEKDRRDLKSPTLVKTCEETGQIRECRTPQDWALLALQNVRTGKSQYLVICRCNKGNLDGPMSHDQPAYARVPGIRVYGMMCNSRNLTTNRKGRAQQTSSNGIPEFPWDQVQTFSSTLSWN